MSSHVAPELDFLDTITLPERERVNAGQLAVVLESESDSATLRFLLTEEKGLSGETIANLRHFVAHALDVTARGATAVLVAVADQEVSTGAAAEMLGISRTHLVNLIEGGVIPARKRTTGKRSHRRVRLADIMAYRERSRLAASGLAALEVLAQEYDLDDLDETGTDDEHTTENAGTHAADGIAPDPTPA